MARRRKGDLSGLLILAFMLIVLTIIGYYYWFRRLIRSGLDYRLIISIALFQITLAIVTTTGIYHAKTISKDLTFISLLIQFSIGSLIAFVPTLIIQWLLEKFQPSLRRLGAI